MNINRLLVIATQRNEGFIFYFLLLGEVSVQNATICKHYFTSPVLQINHQKNHLKQQPSIVPRTIQAALGPSKIAWARGNQVKNFHIWALDQLIANSLRTQLIHPKLFFTVPIIYCSPPLRHSRFVEISQDPMKISRSPPQHHYW